MPAVPEGTVAVKVEYWTVAEAVELLAEALWVDLGGIGTDPDPVTLEALARALDLSPEMLELVWNTWESEMVLADWTQGRRDEAQYWLDAVLIGGIAEP